MSFGYIEIDQDENLYNSAAVLDRDGKVILNYRKTHLYYNDKLWAKSGDGFKNFKLISNEGHSF